MQVPKLTKWTERLVSVSLVLIFLAFFGSMVLGWSVRTIRNENLTIDTYLLKAEEVKPNFENSLKIYTENTENAIEYVQTLRPANELEYIEFISKIEEIGEDLSLNLSLQSKDLPITVTDSILRYEISFSGSQSDMLDFLEAVEFLPYYTRVQNLDYVPLSQRVLEDSDAPNVEITLDLYVK